MAPAQPLTEMGSYELFALAGLEPQSSYLYLLSFWDYKHELLCPAFKTATEIVFCKHRDLEKVPRN
jgi:hypothetical protein